MKKCEWIDEKGSCTLTSKHLSCGVVDLRSCALKREQREETKTNGHITIH